MGQEVTIKELMHQAGAMSGQQSMGSNGTALSIMQEIRGMISEIKGAALAIVEAIKAKQDLTTHVQQLKQITTGENMPAQNTAQPAMRLETPRGPLIKADVLVAQLAQLFEKVKDIEKDGKKVQDMTVKEIKERMAQSPNIAAMIIAEFYNNNWDKFLEIR